MKPYTLKNACKEWTIEEIAGAIFSAGMGFMANGNDDKMSKELHDEKHTLIKELKKRYKK